MKVRKAVRVIKKVRLAPAVWRFVTVPRRGTRYVWDPRPGFYLIEWWEGPVRRREAAGRSPTEVLEAVRRKQLELAGAIVLRDKSAAATEPADSPAGTLLRETVKAFLDHVRVHSPSKPRTVARYRAALDHFVRILGHRQFLQQITRADIERYKAARLDGPGAGRRRGSRVSASTVNFEVSVVRTMFHYAQRELGVAVENPCARFKPLRDAAGKGGEQPSVYRPEEIERLLAACGPEDRDVLLTLLLTGLREQELCTLTWEDVVLEPGRERILVRAKPGFTPKDYEQREIPIPELLVQALRARPRTSVWVFPSAAGGLERHLLRRLKRVAARTGVEHATLHKFRHTYATRLLESGADVVTVQRLLGHSDLDTTRRYLNPDAERQRAAVTRLEAMLGGEAAS